MKYLLSLILAFVFSGFVQAAYISIWRGEVEVKKAGADKWERVLRGEKTMLASGDELRTARASTVEVLMDDGSKVKMAPLSAFKMTENNEAASLQLYFGRVRSWVKKFTKKFEVRTPSAVCAVRGTDFTVSADAEGNTKVEVYEGSVLAGDSSGATGLITQGQFTEIPKGGKMKEPHNNPNPPGNLNTSIGDAKALARREIYNEMSKEDVLASAQAEIQSAEYQNRKVAIDAFGNRVRMEEYIVRPAEDQFKYVVLNTRAARFDFGKILFTFNNALPSDLSLATKNMISAYGSTRPEWELTEINSIMSNTLDKMTEDASGGKMVPDDAGSPTVWTHFFSNYAVYAYGWQEGDNPAAVPNGGMGTMLWSFNDSNSDNTVQGGEISYLGPSGPCVTAPTGGVTSPSGDDVFHTITRNTYSDGTWISAEDYVLFDNGKILSTGDLASTLGSNMDKVTDKLNFERIYTSSLFGGRKIDLEYSAKLLKDAGLLRF
ncbi:MAG TPA: hypothetical protein DCL44_09980 [Elusimicrobia bacterium]|nr:hypothetical protein [Elusimicrobiota bacterium]